MSILLMVAKTRKGGNKAAVRTSGWGHAHIVTVSRDFVTNYGQFVNKLDEGDDEEQYSSLQF